MKDVSNKLSRNSLIYSRKRPSPNGVSKSHKTPLIPPFARSPRSAKAALIQQRQRDLTAHALRREGVILEEEYRDEIRSYMLEMEVGSCLIPTRCHQADLVFSSSSVIQCPLPSPWTSSQR